MASPQGDSGYVPPRCPVHRQLTLWLDASLVFRPQIKYLLQIFGVFFICCFSPVGFTESSSISWTPDKCTTWPRTDPCRGMLSPFVWCFCTKIQPTKMCVETKQEVGSVSQEHNTGFIVSSAIERKTTPTDQFWSSNPTTNQPSLC